MARVEKPERFYKRVELPDAKVIKRDKAGERTIDTNTEGLELGPQALDAIRDALGLPEPGG